MPQTKREELKRLGWSFEEFRQKYYWYLVMTDDHRILTFDSCEYDKRMAKMKLYHEAYEQIRENNRKKAERKQL